MPAPASAALTPARRRLPGLLLALALSLLATATLRAEPPAPSITVSGDALINVAPDRVVVNFGIVSRDADLLAAKAQGVAIYQKALAALKAQGVAEGEIECDAPTIEQLIRDDKGKDWNGFVVRQSFAVTLRDPAKVEPLVAACMTAGITFLHGVDYQLADVKTVREQARVEALKDARSKAVKMAAVLGQQVGPALSITEGAGGSGWNTRAWGWGGGRGVYLAQTMMQPTGDAEGVADGQALGKFGVTASVRVVFALLPGKD